VLLAVFGSRERKKQKKFMRDYSHKIAFIVATKDRPEDLRRMLSSLKGQSYLPQEIIIVDGSEKSVRDIVQALEFSSLTIRYLRCLPPSATRQRNMGIDAVSRDISLVGFLDDDIRLEPRALEKMMDFWQHAAEDVAGAAFNLVNHPPLYASRLKRLPVVRRFGLYSQESGAVLASGFQVMIGHPEATTFVRWICIGASVWRREVFAYYRLDEWYDGYSYLEDLDFSYNIGQKYKLAVVAEADYYHYPASSGRGSGYVFGRREVANRIYFVKKHSELSRAKCYLALFVRMLISLALALQEREMNYVSRALGNLIGLAESMI
jgi:GT2 family glycosyltransferase